MKRWWLFCIRSAFPKKRRELDAEGIEHHVSPETLAAFERLLKKS